MILVTGASGFLGQHLLQLLDQQSEPVVALYHSNKPDIKYQNVIWKNVDLLDFFEVAALLEDIDKIYHCAAIVSFNSKDKEKMILENVNITTNLVNAALEAPHVQRFIYVSSIAALGRAASSEKFISEETHWVESKQNSTYAISKFRSEMEVWRGFAEGLSGAIVNPGIILGAGDFNKGSAQLISNVAKGFPYYTDGVNGWVDVNDVAKALVLLMDADVNEERFILCQGNHSYKDIFSMMATALQLPVPSKRVSPWQAEIVWRLDYLRSTIQGKNPLITKESARTAQKLCYYDAAKFSNTFPQFEYTAIATTIDRMAKAFQQKA